MKRKLTKDEEILEKIGLERNIKELAKLKTQLEYNSDLLNLAKQKQEIDDKYREYLRILTEEENENILKQIKSDISIKENAIKIGEDNLKNGVTIKHTQAG